LKNREWLVIKPNSYEALCYLGQDQNWRIADYDTRYKETPKNTYININKDDDTKIFLDFYNSDFYKLDEETIYLKEFFDINNDLLAFYGEIINCEDIIKENDDYWILCSDYDYFSGYFELDNRTRKDFISKILCGDSGEIFQYDNGNFDLDDYYGNLNPYNLGLLRSTLRFEKLNNKKYDYNISDENLDDYDNISKIVKKYNIKSVKRIIRDCICNANELADADEAYEDVTDEIYKFFNLEMGSAKWQNHNTSKYQKLWIKFKTNDDAYYAKFRINNYDDSYNEDMIDFSTPYNGYHGDSKNVEIQFNDSLSDNISNHDDIDEILEFDLLWKEVKSNLNLPDDEMMKEMKTLIDAKKYNL